MNTVPNSADTAQLPAAGQNVTYLGDENEVLWSGTNHEGVDVVEIRSIRHSGPAHTVRVTDLDSPQPATDTELAARAALTTAPGQDLDADNARALGLYLNGIRAARHAAAASLTRILDERMAGI